MRLKDQKGFSLLEVLLYISATVIVISGFFSLYLSILSAQAKSKAIAEVEMQSYYLMETITREIKNAQQILSPTDANNVSRLEYINQANQLTAIYLENDYIIQSIDNQNVLLNTDKIKINNLTFANNSYADTASIIKINLTAAYQTNTLRPEYNYTQTFTVSARQNIKK